MKIKDLGNGILEVYSVDIGEIRNSKELMKANLIYRRYADGDAYIIKNRWGMTGDNPLGRMMVSGEELEEYKKMAMRSWSKKFKTNIFDLGKDPFRNDSTFEEITGSAKKMAIQNNCVVRFEHDDIEMHVSPDSNETDIMDLFNVKRENSKLRKKLEEIRELL